VSEGPSGGSPGERTTIHTVGHSTRPVNDFLDVLAANEIALAIDVRSVPFVKHAPHFRQEQISVSLPERGIEYLWLGEHLGQKPEGDEYFDEEGHALYEVISKEPWYMKAIGRVEYEAERRPTAIFCLEEPPERCHRYHLLGRTLVDRGAEVLHLRLDGSTESQSQVSQRLGEGQASIFGDSELEVWRSPEPMRDPLS
jgi:uncharacterized protein (DUF488 family)